MTSILSGFTYPHSPEFAFIDFKRFNNFDPITKGRYLMSEYKGLIEASIFKINTNTFSRIGHRTEYSEGFYKVTSNKLLQIYIEKIDHLYRTWCNQISNIDDPILRKIKAILEWMRLEKYLPKHISLYDIYVFLHNHPAVKNDFNEIYIEAPFVLFYYMSKTNEHLLNHDDVSTLEVELSGTHTLSILAPHRVDEYYESSHREFDTTLGMVDKLHNRDKAILDNRNRSHRFSVMLSRTTFIDTINIDVKKLSLNSNMTILEYLLANTTSRPGTDIGDYLVFIYSFDIGYLNPKCDLVAPPTLTYRERALKEFIKLYHCTNNNQYLTNHDPKHNSIIMALLTAFHNNKIKSDTNTPFIQYLLGSVEDSLVKPKEVGVENKTSVESLGLISKVDGLIYRVTMEDEDTEDPPGEEATTETEEETTEDNIEEDNVEESETSDEEDEDDDSGDLDSEESEESSSDDDSSSSTGSTTTTESAKVPKNQNANTSSSIGIRLELDVNPTFDSVVVKRELSSFIDSLLLNAKISPRQRLTLEEIKSKWMGILTSRSLIDWIERTLNRTIFKKS